MSYGAVDDEKQATAPGRPALPVVLGLLLGVASLVAVSSRSPFGTTISAKEPTELKSHSHSKGDAPKDCVCANGTPNPPGHCPRPARDKTAEAWFADRRFILGDPGIGENNACADCDKGYRLSETDLFGFKSCLPGDCPPGQSKAKGGGTCEWNKCVCPNGTPYTGETVHEATCGSTESGRVDTHPCPATACDDDQENRRCKSCNDGFRNHWLNPGSWYEGYASSCVECSYDDMKDKDKLHNGCECVHYPHFCTSSDQCCGKNVCHGWSLEKGFDGRVCGPSCISNGESCEFIKCCDGLSCQQPDNTCVKN
mmetsp:Transcript_3377/g.10443  ORF Transcript_3377/g.10443 Transcript_3377/m.10443 type:complete len:311 (-) Transcript_3377:88-1020(-)